VQAGACRPWGEGRVQFTACYDQPVSLGDLTKQFAKQAIGDTVKDIIDPQAAAPAPLDIGSALLAEVQAMQKALREEDELVVLFPAGNEMIRVFEIYTPTKAVAVLSGLDPQKNRTRVVTPVHALQLVCKVFRVAPGAKPTRVNFIAPKGAGG
jgi:hypothetical protein